MFSQWVLYFFGQLKNSNFPKLPTKLDNRVPWSHREKLKTPSESQRGTRADALIQIHHPQPTTAHNSPKLILDICCQGTPGVKKLQSVQEAPVCQETLICQDTPICQDTQICQETLICQDKGYWTDTLHIMHMAFWHISYGLFPVDCCQFANA